MRVRQSASDSVWNCTSFPRYVRFLQIALGPVILLVLWYAAGALGILNTRLIPPPDAVFATTWTAMTQGTMVNDLTQTLGRVVLSFLIAAGIGVPIGIVIGANERVYRSAEFLIDFFRSTPATAMFPLFMLIFGLGDQGKIALAAFSALADHRLQRRLWRPERAQDAHHRRALDGCRRFASLPT